MPEIEAISQANDKIVEELAKDYACYIKTDLPNETKKVHDTVEDMMIRLEEFESIVGMVQNVRAECTFEHLVRLKSIQPKLAELCQRIDALEHVVARASCDLNSLEIAVDNAEAVLGGHATVSERILGIFNPLSLFRNKTPEVSGTSSGLTTTLPRREQGLDLPPIFRTADAFKATE